jgi:hypothetical protein
MKNDITTLSALITGISIIITLVQRFLLATLGTSSFRANLFFKSRLADVKMALAHLGETRRGAYESIMDARIFKFMFGFHGSRVVRNGIYGALESGLLSESQVKICGYRLSIRDDLTLEVKKSKGESSEFWFYIVSSILMFISTLFLVLAILQEKTLTLSTVLIGLLAIILGMLFAFKSLSEVFDIVVIRSTRNQLASNQQCLGAKRE